MPAPPFPKILKDGLILAMLTLKLLLNNKKELAKEVYLPFTMGLIMFNSHELA